MKTILASILLGLTVSAQAQLRRLRARAGCFGVTLMITVLASDHIARAPATALIE